MALTKGSLEATEGQYINQPVIFMFNPSEYQISKTITWSPSQSSKTANVRQMEFGGGEPRSLTLTLFFDSYLPRSGVQTESVRDSVNRLFNFTMIDDQIKDHNSGMSRPPLCRMLWGTNSSFSFKCVVASCSAKYTMFNADGVPIRATVSLTLTEAEDATAPAPQNPTSQGDPGQRVRVVMEGDRIDWIAYQEYGDATQWRRIAEANRLADPLDLRAGMVLSIPSL